MLVSVVAKWSSRGEPRFVDMLDALTRARDGVPIARDEVKKKPTSAVFSHSVVRVNCFLNNIPCSSTLYLLSGMLLRCTVQCLTSLRVRAAAVARSACVTWSGRFNATARVCLDVIVNISSSILTRMCFTGIFEGYCCHGSASRVSQALLEDKQMTCLHYASIAYTLVHPSQLFVHICQMFLR